MSKVTDPLLDIEESGDKVNGDHVEVDHWTKFEKEQFPDIFGHLELADDGGFSEVGQLYNSSRWASCVLLVAFVLYNVYSVAMLDIDFVMDPSHLAGYSESITKEINTDFYLSTQIFGTETFKPVQVLGLLEAAGLLSCLMHIVVYVWQIRFGTDKQRWYAVSFLFWDTLPTLSIFSAMKLLDKIVPSKFTANLNMELAFAQERMEKKRGFVRSYVPLFGMLLTTIVCFIIGFDTFLLKLRIVASFTVGRFTANKLVVCVQFLVQILGVVQLGPFVRQRLFVFIFAGEDGILQESERELMYTFNALLAREFYRSYTFMHFLCMMMSFTDEDFQSLVLNEKALEHNSEHEQKRRPDTKIDTKPSITPEAFPAALPARRSL